MNKRTRAAAAVVPQWNGGRGIVQRGALDMDIKSPFRFSMAERLTLGKKRRVVGGEAE